MGQFIIDFHVMYINTLLIALCATAAFARPQLVRPNDDRVPLDKNTKDQSKIVNHIKELINNVVAQEQEEVKVGNLQKPLEFYDTVIKAGDTTTTTTTTTTTRKPQPLLPQPQLRPQLKIWGSCLELSMVLHQLLVASLMEAHFWELPEVRYLAQSLLDAKSVVIVKKLAIICKSFGNV